MGAFSITLPPFCGCPTCGTPPFIAKPRYVGIWDQQNRLLEIVGIICLKMCGFSVINSHEITGNYHDKPSNLGMAYFFKHTKVSSWFCCITGSKNDLPRLALSTEDGGSGKLYCSETSDYIATLQGATNCRSHLLDPFWG